MAEWAAYPLPVEPTPTPMIVWITHDPFCRCYSWTAEEFQWRSRTKAKRVCVWCAAKRDKYLPQREL